MATLRSFTSPPPIVWRDEEEEPRLEPVYDYDDEGYLISDGLPMAEYDPHLNQMIYCIEALRIFFSERGTLAYVGGNNFLHYKRGDKTKHLSPDCYVVFGVEQRERLNFKSWEEGGASPAIAFEITSRKTWQEDIEVKTPIYEQAIGVPEYIMFDPYGDYLKPRLQGFRLKRKRYSPIVPDKQGRLWSEGLGLYLLEYEGKMRFFDPESQEMLRTPAEEARGRREALAQARQERAAREDAERRAKDAETEMTRLRAELEALRNRPNA